MEFRKLHSVITLAELGSFTKAAAALFVTQPSLSQTIGSIEKQLDIRLFDRSEAPIRLTPAGELYVASARKIISEYKGMKEDIMRLSGKRGGRIRVGTSNFRSIFMLPKLISLFRETNPQAKIHIVEREASGWEAMLEEGKIDFAIYSLPLEKPDLFGHKIICREKILLAVPPNHPFHKKYPAPVRRKYREKGEYPPANLADFRNEAFVLLDNREKMYAIAMAACEAEGFHCIIAQQSPTLISAHSMMLAGVGPAFIPDSFLIYGDTAHRDIYYAIGSSGPSRQVALVYRKAPPLSPLQESFADMLKQVFAGNGSPGGDLLPR